MELPMELYMRYFERRVADAAKLNTALDQNSIEEFQTIGHQIKGNASSFGFDDLAVIGREMESLSLDQLSHRGRELLNQFEKWIAENRSKFSSIT